MQQIQCIWVLLWCVMLSAQSVERTCEARATHFGCAYELASARQLLCNLGDVPLTGQGPDFDPALHDWQCEVDFTL